MQRTGLPRALARQVVCGQLTANDAIRRLAIRTQVEGLISTHQLPKSLATQIALGQADLEQVLRKRRLKEHLLRMADHSALLVALADETPLTLFLHGQRVTAGRVTGVDRYEVVLDGKDGEERVHKLQIKMLCASSDLRRARRQIKRAPKVPRTAEPVPLPQDRYGCSDRRLFGYLDQETDVRVTLLEGERLRGTVTWLSRWEFGLQQRKGVEMTVFRHALADIRSW